MTELKVIEGKRTQLECALVEAVCLGNKPLSAELAKRLTPAPVKLALVTGNSQADRPAAESERDEDKER